MITKFKLFESRMSKRVSDQEIHSICKKYDITGYDINPEGSISVDGDVNLSGRSLKIIPLVFKEKVGGDFFCSYNQLASLEGCPEKVGGDFYCYDNQLTSLEGCPEKVGGDFYCSYNQLTSLEGCPEKVGGNFYCNRNQLTSLEGCPEKVGGDFFCSYNNLTSLKGCPDARDIRCVNNKITSFEGIPEFWEGKLSIINNPVDEIFELFNRDVRCIDLINEFDVIQGDKVSRDRLEEVFSHLDMEIPKNIKLKNYKLI